MSKPMYGSMLSSDGSWVFGASDGFVCRKSLHSEVPKSKTGALGLLLLKGASSGWVFPAG